MLSRPMLSEGTGYETWQSPLLYDVMFLLDILGVDPALNPVKYKRLLCVFIQLSIRSITIM